MQLSKEMRLLQSKWASTTGWPKRIEWLEIEGVRGWTGQRVEFKFPMVAICGENGCGKSTVLQAAASAYKQNGDQTDWYASDFFPETAWDKLLDAELRYSVRQGNSGSTVIELRRSSDRWTGYNKRLQRDVQYIDLARIQPISSRVGYARLAKPTVKEKSANEFGLETLHSLSGIMGRKYARGKMAITYADDERAVPVVSVGTHDFSAFHQGAGETTVAELLNFRFNQGSLVLIDEIETSLHPRAQRRLIRDLAARCRDLELQIILSTHSPYVLDEFPPEARCYIFQPRGQRQVVFGVSPEFAMTQMDDEWHPECDLYVEDDRARVMLREILVVYAPDLVSRCQIVPFGSASVGQSLGQMVRNGRFPRPSLVFLDGDQAQADGCIILPGGDAPERVVFEALKSKNWTLLDMRTGRDFSKISDACARAMTGADHHEWVGSAARDLILGTDSLWNMMASTWAGNCLLKQDADRIVNAVRVILE